MWTQIHLTTSLMTRTIVFKMFVVFPELTIFRKHYRTWEKLKRPVSCWVWQSFQTCEISTSMTLILTIFILQLKSFLTQIFFGLFWHINLSFCFGCFSLFCNFGRLFLQISYRLRQLHVFKLTKNKGVGFNILLL